MSVHSFLDERRINYRIVPHKKTFSARYLARTLDEDASRIAKTVVLATDKGYVLCVIPADRKVDMATAVRVLGASSVMLANESECEALFPESELGAMPPFGSMHGLRTIVDLRLLEAEELIFEAESHRYAIAMHTSDFKKVENPEVHDISRPG